MASVQVCRLRGDNQEYPPPNDFQNGIFQASRAEIEELQEERLRWKVEQAWEIPFYRKLWQDADVNPDDIQTLGDLDKIPIYDVTDIKESLKQAPH